MKKQQFLLIGSGLILIVILYFFGKTTIPVSESPGIAANGTAESKITTDTLLQRAKEHIPIAQLSTITQLENSVVRGDVKEQQIRVYKQLASMWGDTLKHPELGNFYNGEAAKLENSEKNLTFAARFFLNELLVSDNAAMQNWLATNAKDLFERAILLNGNNDSLKIGLGACYIFGNISDNPMQGILPIRQIVEKDSNNLYAQMILGLGGVKSGQYDKAAERFLFILKKQPDNLEAIFNLAELYDRKGDKVNAVKWYKASLEFIKVPEAVKEIEQRIKALE